MKHLYGGDWLASVEELPKAFSAEGSWACEQKAGLLILGGARCYFLVRSPFPGRVGEKLR